MLCGHKLACDALLIADRPNNCMQGAYSHLSSVILLALRRPSSRRIGLHLNVCPWGSANVISLAHFRYFGFEHLLRQMTNEKRERLQQQSLLAPDLVLLLLLAAAVPAVALAPLVASWLLLAPAVRFCSQLRVDRLHAGTLSALLHAVLHATQLPAVGLMS